MGILALTLQILCNMNLSLIAWMIVFIPFVTMTIFTGLLLFVFGASAIGGGGPTYDVDYPTTQQSNNSDYTYVTRTGINQPYSSGVSVKPGGYINKDESSTRYRPSGINEKGVLYSTAQNSVAEGFEPVMTSFESKLTKHMETKKKQQSELDLLNGRKTFIFKENNS